MQQQLEELIRQIIERRPIRTQQELATALRDASFDDAVGVIVLTGAGDRAFCTGGDVKEYAEDYVRTPRDYWNYMTLFRSYIESILNSGKPVVARINGIAVGGGVLYGIAASAVSKRRSYAGVTIAAVVVSHWFLDVVTHRPDLPLTLSATSRFGLGLWNSVLGTVAAELTILVAGIALYLRATGARDRVEDGAQAVDRNTGVPDIESIGGAG